MAEVPMLYREALEKFEEGRYHEAHEAFEALWHAASGKERDLYQGWVLVCAALFHRDRGNARGAKACLERAEVHWKDVGVRPGFENPARVLEAVRRVLDREWIRPELGDSREGRGWEKSPRGEAGWEEDAG
jgi:hypothetical protein